VPGCVGAQQHPESMFAVPGIASVAAELPSTTSYRLGIFATSEQPALAAQREQLPSAGPSITRSLPFRTQNWSMSSIMLRLMFN